MLLEGKEETLVEQIISLHRKYWEKGVEFNFFHNQPLREDAIMW